MVVLPYYFGIRALDQICNLGLLFGCVTETSAQSSKDTLGTPTRNGSTSPRKDSRETSSGIPRSLSIKDSPRKDISSVSVARSQSGIHLPRDSFLRSGLPLSKTQSGKDLVKDMGLSPRPHTMVTRSQSGKDIKDAMGLSPRHTAARESSGSPSGKESKDGGSPLRSLQSSSRIRRVGVSERRGLTASSGSSEKEVSDQHIIVVIIVIVVIAVDRLCGVRLAYLTIILEVPVSIPG